MDIDAHGMTQFTIQQAFDVGLQHQLAGRLREAELVYRHILAQQPGHVDSLHHLGILAHQVGRHDIAVGFIQQALALAPDAPEILSNLGLALLGQGNVDQAIAAFDRAIAINPNNAAGFYNLAIARQQKQELDAAIAAYHKAIDLNPNYVEALGNLGNALGEKGETDEAIAAYHQALKIRPDLPEVLSNLGIALLAKRRIDEAIAAFRQAIALAPKFAPAHSNLGNALEKKDALDEAVTMQRQAIAIHPKLFQAHNNLGSALRRRGLLDEAISAYLQSLAINPNFAEAHGGLGTVLLDVGRLDDAIASYRRAIAIDPRFTEADSNLVYALQFHPGYSAATIADEHRRWGRQHADPLANCIEPHDNDRAPDHRLRIGYVSADFRDHVVGRCLLPVLKHYDRRHFEIFCYANVHRPDEATAEFQSSVDGWRNIAGLSDDQAARQIRQDKIDILVDLSLHTSGNRLLIFARKPAPVQVTYLAYPGTSGMSAMDYRISDPHIDPPDADLSGYVEKTARLPKSYWCYQPGSAAMPVSPLPASELGYITFGCLNSFKKVNPAALDAWSKILLETPNSRLILHVPPSAHAIEIVSRMHRAGVAENRLRFVERQSWSDYARMYDQIDIALDPFPYNGGITTCDALWMGAAVVTLSGETAVGRAGRSILSNVGLDELIASTPEQYVRIAVNLAKDGQRLSDLRRGLRHRMQASPLMDAAALSRDLESAYQHMWKMWCTGSKEA